MEKFKKQYKLLKTLLRMDVPAVGVRFLYSEDDFKSCKAEYLKGFVPYCVMVKLALHHMYFKVDKNNFKCSGGAKALGITPIDDYARSGKNYLKLGLCQDIPTARKFQEDLATLPYPVHGVELGPLESFEYMPDVIIFVSEAYEAMRLLQGYSFKYGIKPDFKLSGSQAICVECTAQPYLSNGINISLMCAGTRFWCGWEHSQLAVGIAAGLFSDIVEGVLATCNPVDTIASKLEILDSCEENNVDIPIDLKNSYYYSFSDKQISLEKNKR